VCLMQLSYRKSSNGSEIQNYLVDTLALREHLGKFLQPTFADPDVVKVMHGADSDIPWLQRDFGLYIVNLFDTGRAARALQLPSAGYAFLLQKYAGVVADKSFQLADWRQRPLPPQMQHYAIQDTYYLLDIYDRLKWDLYRKGGEDLIRDVLDASKFVCSIRYAVDPFNPDGYKVLLSRRGSRRRSELNDLQERVLMRLWEWRDRMARQYDESGAYVCSNKALHRIALAGQTTVSLRALQSLFHPLPPLILKHSQEVIDLIRHEVNQEKQKQDELPRGEDTPVDDEDEEDEEIANSQRQQQPVGAPSSAFFKPEKDLLRRGMTSPVLGTEALYKQAGWMTPEQKDKGMIVDVTTTSTDEDDPSLQGSEKPKRLLSVHASNKNYCSSRGSSSTKGNRSVDGMATVRAAREHSQSPVSRSIEEEVEAAKQSSAQIRISLTQKDALPAVLGLVTQTVDVDDDDTAGDGGEEGGAGGGTTSASDEEDFPVPRSMREIYKISNRNRRNKKTGSPTPERGVTPTSEKEREELAAAEALMRDRGVLATAYFDESGNSPGKRQRTKNLSGRESEESIPPESHVSAASREEDLAVIRSVGWMQGTSGEGSFGGSSGVTGQHQHQNPPAFDYSTVGAIGAMGTSQGQNPFFAGAAAAGGSTATQAFSKPEQQRTNRGSARGGRQNRRRERPEKKDGKSTSYRRR